MGKQFMSIRETARFTGLSENYIRKEVRLKTMPFIMSGNKVLINVPMLLEQINEQCKRDMSKINIMNLE